MFRMLRRWRGSLPPGVVLPAALGVALVLVALPLPGMALDLLLAASLTFSLLLAVVALLTDEPVRLSAFPALLVVSSLARIGLCLAVARTIVSGNWPGALVEGLGDSLTNQGTNLIGGLIMLVVVALVGFLVTTVGLMRLSEVAARFALDALPGRQMALDSALAGGRVTSEEGMALTQKLDATSSFFGAMDGVARFLRGETIATVVIVALTAGGAMALRSEGGPGQAITNGLSMAVGHGLCLLVPGIVASAAAAMLVARSGAGAGLGEMGEELLARPAVLGAVAVALLTMGLAPGVARWPLWVVAAIMAAVAFWAHRRQERRQWLSEEGPETRELSLRLGLGLIGPLVGRDLMQRISAMRASLSDELGFVVGGITVSDVEEMGMDDVALYLGGELIAEGTLHPGRRLAIPPAEGVLPPGEETLLPNGTPAVWVSGEEITGALALGCRLLEPIEVLLIHVSSAVRREAALLLDGQRIVEIMESVRASHPMLVQDLQSTGVTTAEICQVGKLLLREGVPLTERVTLLEALGNGARETSAPELLAEAVRPALTRTLTRLVAPSGRAEVISLNAELEEELAEALERGGRTHLVTMPPERWQAWQQTLRSLTEVYALPGQPATVLCAASARLPLAQLVAQGDLPLRVVQPAELHPLTQIHVLHQVSSLETPAPAGMRE